MDTNGNYIYGKIFLLVKWTKGLEMKCLERKTAKKTKQERNGISSKLLLGMKTENNSVKRK